MNNDKTNSKFNLFSIKIILIFLGVIIFISSCQISTAINNLSEKIEKETKRSESNSQTLNNNLSELREILSKE
ncbi:TPA: hypothetical protein QCU37_005412 [Bacillus cereus]|nr:hypothetical protein [Bacillus cereus]